MTRDREWTPARERHEDPDASIEIIVKDETDENGDPLYSAVIRREELVALIDARAVKVGGETLVGQNETGPEGIDPTQPGPVFTAAPRTQPMVHQLGTADRVCRNNLN